MSPRALEALWSSGAKGFVDSLGGLFEHSPWVVERAFERGPFADADALIAACAGVLSAAAPEEKLALIRAHPELAGKALIAGTLTAASSVEQKTAGLDRLTPQEFERFHALNQAYRGRFDFPFVICVRLSDKSAIMEALEARQSNAVETEIEVALCEILRIARLRLETSLAAGAAGPAA